MLFQALKGAWGLGRAGLTGTKKWTLLAQMAQRRPWLEPRPHWRCFPPTPGDARCGWKETGRAKRT